MLLLLLLLLHIHVDGLTTLDRSSRLTVSSCPYRRKTISCTRAARTIQISLLAVCFFRSTIIKQGKITVSNKRETYGGSSLLTISTAKYYLGQIRKITKFLKKKWPSALSFLFGQTNLIKSKITWLFNYQAPDCKLECLFVIYFLVMPISL